ncbi:hypothetical protein CDAR_245451 [Caerostris darwini]|uniref:Uncharacterized protein n=1 Tax=Caerostris darwini TaxID=1538125 RepID=A0AAV4NY35_9ARAC|nr:hypothetical protein CDAR_245131 [Caerostris darwini]GIX89799.1 hypothetical protein CDAR_245451 [Caerostris darwini]
MLLASARSWSSPKKMTGGNKNKTLKLFAVKCDMIDNMIKRAGYITARLQGEGEGAKLFGGKSSFCEKDGRKRFFEDAEAPDIWPSPKCFLKLSEL